jgi:L-lactate dehydrogenase complex protein LldF
MGAVLTPLLVGLDRSHALPDASTLCGRCEAVCPLSIPLPQMLREHRNASHRQKLDSFGSRLGLQIWALAARRPRAYRWLVDRMLSVLSRLSNAGKLRRIPLVNGWMATRDFPQAPGRSFLTQWAKKQKAGKP